MNEETTIIEINGVKLEVDLRHAKRVDTLRVGDRVKLLEKQYGNSIKIHPAIIAGFEPFQSAPTIIVAYLEISYSTADVKFAYINTADEESKKFELVPSIDNDLPVDPSDILELMDREIARKQVDVDDLKRRREFFMTNFQKYFPQPQ